MTSNSSSRTGLIEVRLKSLMFATLLHSDQISDNTQITSDFDSSEQKKNAACFFL